MADEITMQIEGVSAVVEMFDKLSGFIDSPEFDAAMLESAAVIEREVRKQIDMKIVTRTGELKKKLKVAQRKPKKNRYGTKIIGVRSSAMARKADGTEGGPYPIFLEYGTENKRGETRIKARSFMRTGLDEAEPQVMKVLNEALAKAKV